MAIHITCIFGPVTLSVTETAATITTFIAQEYSGNISSSYAKIRFNEQENDFEFFDEELNLKDRDDLLSRLTRDGAGVWSCEVDMKFASAEVDLATFNGPTPSDGTTLLITFEKELTSYLTDYIAPRAPFGVFLARLAEAIGSDCFVAGAELDTWLPIPVSGLIDRNRLGDCPYVVGWRQGVVEDEAMVASLFDLPASAVLRSTTPFRFILLFPELSAAEMD